MRPLLRATVGRSLRPMLALVTVVVLAGCAAGATTASSPVATTTVDLPKSYKFVPARITVPAGSTVTWTNNDDFTHNVALPDGPEPLTMAPGSSVTYTFSTAGTFPYVCSLHPKDMKGSVVVTDT